MCSVSILWDNRLINYSRVLIFTILKLLKLEGWGVWERHQRQHVLRQNSWTWSITGFQLGLFTIHHVYVYMYTDMWLNNAAAVAGDPYTSLTPLEGVAEYLQKQLEDASWTNQNVCQTYVFKHFSQSGVKRTILSSIRLPLPPSLSVCGCKRLLSQM